MNLEQLFAAISTNQRKMIQALLDHPEGLLSNELAELTAVSNKSATMTPDLRELLEQNGLELVIERVKGCSKWVIRPVDKEEEVVSIPAAHIMKAAEMLEVISRMCQEVKFLLC